MKIKEEEIICLRGHHLDILCKLYENPRLRLQELKKKIVDNEEYGTERQRLILAKRGIQVFKKILQGQVQVKIVCDTDAICQNCIRRATDECTNQLISKTAIADRQTAIFYGLELDTIYSAEEVIKKIAESIRRQLESEQ